VNRVDCDVGIVGAGAALTAAAYLAREGASVKIIEAGSRIGGRVLTLRDPLLHFPV
jgi:phytoene dehydrogenase-like protein